MATPRGQRATIAHGAAHRLCRKTRHPGPDHTAPGGVPWIAMRTLIISDLHVGPDTVAPIYAGDGALPELITRTEGPLRVILNGDTFDLLLEDRPLLLEVAQAVA